MRRHKALVTGASGQVGFELQRALGFDFEVVALDRAACDLQNLESVRDCVRQIAPTLIVNAAAYTAVDRAESEAEKADRVNGEAVGVLAEEAKRLGAALVHYSTDYVFDGEATQPYCETAPTAPLNVYGSSKLKGEQLAQQVGGDCWILRTTWVFGLHGSNFLKTMIRLAQQKEQLSVVSDQLGAPTSAALIADVTARLLRSRPDTGVYHLSASGMTSWYEYAQRVISLAECRGLDTKVKFADIQPIRACDYPTPAKRPRYSLLDCRKLESALDVKLPDWKIGVDQVVQILVDNKR